MLPNLIICISIYVLGHLVPHVGELGGWGSSRSCRFVAELLATVLPVLDHFNIQAAISGGKDVPLNISPLGRSLRLLYSTVAMLLALLLFRGSRSGVTFGEPPHNGR